MKKILIISEYFAPENEVGAIRMSKLAKYLCDDYGYQIFVITRQKEIQIRDETLNFDSQQDIKIIRVSSNKTLEKMKNKINNINGNSKFKRSNTKSFSQISFIYFKLKRKLLNGLYYFITTMVEPISYSRRALKKIAIELELKDFDVVISTYGPSSGHVIAKQIKDKFPNIKWIADFRDPVLNIFTPMGFRLYAKYYPKYITRNADYVVAVSEGYLKALGIGDTKKKKVITNGYDYDDIKNIDLQDIDIDNFVLTYTGGLYSGKRDFGVLFRALSELNDEMKINIEKVVINYAGSSIEELLVQARRFNLETVIKYQGVLSRSEALKLQLGSDILLLATWNTKKGEGNIPGKFFEYMMVKKPIVCIQLGEILNSELKKIIVNGEFGYRYEEANHKVNLHELKSYITMLYNNKKNNNSFEFKPNISKLNQYSYKKIASNFNEMIKTEVKIDDIYTET